MYLCISAFLGIFGRFSSGDDFLIGFNVSSEGKCLGAGFGG